MVKNSIPIYVVDPMKLHCTGVNAFLTGVGLCMDLQDPPQYFVHCQVITFLYYVDV